MTERTVAPQAEGFAGTVAAKRLELAPEPDAFAALARATMGRDGHTWASLSRETGIHANTLRHQLRDNTDSLRLATARAVARVLGVSMWEQAAA